MNKTYCDRCNEEIKDRYHNCLELDIGVPCKAEFTVEAELCNDCGERAIRLFKEWIGGK